MGAAGAQREGITLREVPHDGLLVHVGGLAPGVDVAHSGQHEARRGQAAAGVVAGEVGQDPTEGEDADGQNVVRLHGKQRRSGGQHGRHVFTEYPQREVGGRFPVCDVCGGNIRIDNVD